ncbi:unannotated protein [freshwater metagenome]|uniref:Unannotated protein n=1 Tax=freshwater metagenome TaxID=449393 RepID=A0A6J5ZHM3_9ZZZZ|nr:DUF1015 family protein [Actinomycetota bacterium]
MADVRPLNSLRYDLDRVGGLEAVLSPPYDVIDPAQRAELAARSPFNVVGIDLPEPATAGGDPYEHAATLLAEWQQAGALVRDEEPSFWILTQDYLAPDGNRRTRSGFLAAVKIEEYGAGKIRPHERTHPGPKEDRLRLTRATKTNLSPIFALYSDATGGARATIAAETESGPYGEQIDEDGTINRLWRVSDLDAQAALSAALDPAELLIADGHHRYETARIYADEIGGDGPHRFVMMDLVALEDPGLSVFPTHRLVSGLADDPERANALRETIEACFEITELSSTDELPPNGLSADGRLQFGYLDSRHKRPLRLVLRDQSIADEALADFPPPYRKLDAAVLEALILKGPLALSEDDISHFNGLGYSRNDEEALALLDSGEYDAAFFLSGAPIEQIQEIAAAGVNMPPKSTFFTPKVPTGLLFNPLS